MTFIYIIKKIIGNWINTLAKTNMMQDLVVRETQSVNVSKLNVKLSNKKCGL